MGDGVDRFGRGVNMSPVELLREHERREQVKKASAASEQEARDKTPRMKFAAVRGQMESAISSIVTDLVVGEYKTSDLFAGKLMRLLNAIEEFAEATRKMERIEK